MKISKDQYVLRSLSKIKHKKWEHFNKLCEKDITIIQGMIVGTITTTHVGDTPIDDLIKDLPDDDKDSD